jgi:5-bromo-4-chloroindolyl phosphate hydrolysis protein
MSKQGMLPQVWYDSDKTTLILTRNVYDQYKQTESYRQDLVKQAQEEAATWGNISGDVKSIIEEGNNYKDKIHQYNKEIDDEVMSDKLSRLEEIMNRIFEQVRKQPDTAPKLRKLMQYYLPTTTKLLEAYIELDRQPEAGTNITQTKKEIEDVLDTINDAFEQLLDSMFEDMAWDISSDISVMKSMMNQDGLVQEQGLGQVQEQGQIQ